MINISGLTSIDDPSYRYKMPRLVPKVEGRGNGIKTVIVNVSDIATSLNRDPNEITKFFGFELGAQTTMNTDEDRYIVNGSHTSNDLQHLIHKYIELFVLCRNCHLPETHYKIKSEILSQKCVACGSKDVCDMTHKLTSFILKQHKKMKAEKESTSDGKEKKKDKKEKKIRSDESSVAASASPPGVGGSSGVGEEGENEKKLKKEKKSKKSKKIVVVEEEVGGGGVEEPLEGDTEREALGMFPSPLLSPPPPCSSPSLLAPLLLVVVLVCGDDECVW
jgi:translation initiation factor 5